MSFDELKELIEFLAARDIGEFELEREDVKVRIKRGVAAAAAPAAAPVPIVFSTPPPAAGSTGSPPVVVPAAEASSAASADTSGLHLVRSPMVGTFYESASPGAPAYVKPGDRVQAGQVLCIVEAMKLMNEIEADVDGEIVRRLVENAQPVEYDQPLYAIKKA